jgi:hypothetical protein
MQVVGAVSVTVCMRANCQSFDVKERQSGHEEGEGEGEKEAYVGPTAGRAGRAIAARRDGHGRRARRVRLGHPLGALDDAVGRWAACRLLGAEADAWHRRGRAAGGLTLLGRSDGPSGERQNSSSQ